MVKESSTGYLETINPELYKKLQPILAEIARRSKEKGLDMRSYLFGAVDAQAEGKAKQLYEMAAQKYASEAEEQHYEEKAEEKAEEKTEDIKPEIPEEVKKATEPPITEGLIGKNSDGENIYEDAKGVRYLVHGGIRISEPVFIIPTRGGVKTEISHDDERFIPAERKETPKEVFNVFPDKEKGLEAHVAKVDKGFSVR